MQKIYQSTQRIIAAQILSIALAPAAAESTEAPGAIIKVDTGEEFAVPAGWAAQNGVQVGGYLAILGTHGQGHALFISAERLAADFKYVGDALAPKGEPAPAPAPELPVHTMFDFDQFVEYGRNAGVVPIDQEKMPWSFFFYGHHVSHENDNCYIIAHPTNPHGLRFERGELLFVDADYNITIGREPVPAASEQPATDQVATGAQEGA